MRIAILSDIHAQHQNLIAVIRDAEAQKCNDVWCLGDFVGRGEKPDKVVEEMKTILGIDYLKKSVAGNHDMMVRGDMDVNIFIKDLNGTDANDDELVSVSGTKADLVDMANQHKSIMSRTENQTLCTWLKSLDTHAEPRDHFFITHGAFVLNQDRRPDKAMMFREYTWAKTSIRSQLADLQQSRFNNPYFLAVGHTHVTGLWQKVESERLPRMIWGWDRITHNAPEKQRDEVFFQELTFESVDKNPIFINPGSVGFPRHHDTRPTYVILTIHDDPTTIGIEFREVSVE